MKRFSEKYSSRIRNVRNNKIFVCAVIKNIYLTKSLKNLNTFLLKLVFIKRVCTAALKMP